MSMISKKNLMVLAAGSAALGILAVTGTVFAASGSGGSGNHPIVGTVSTVTMNGEMLTVASIIPHNSSVPTSTIYTVNATNAVVIKDGKHSTFSAISVGDRVIVRGTVSGSIITATVVRDGPHHKLIGWKKLLRNFHGNGEPVVGGNVMAINGTMLTITNSKITYTVNAAFSIIEKIGGTKIPLSSVGIGDRVIVQGVTNGTSVTASSLLDKGVTPIAHSGNYTKGNHKKAYSRFSSAVGFATHLFGF